MSEQEITAELHPQDLASAEPAPESPDVLCSVTFAAKTDLGRVRENNEDKFDWWEPDDAVLLARRGRLYAVADGMGGHSAGQIAAEMALKAIGTAYFATTRESAEEALKRAIVKANALIFDTARAIPSRAGMGCTVVAVALLDAEAVVAWAGDSRAYLVREGAARRLTEDHSWVAEQVRLGVLTEEQAERSSRRNIVTRCLGPEPGVAPDVTVLPLRENDVLLLCSDGLTGAVGDDILAAAATECPPSFACSNLIDLANEAGGPDNITVAVLRIDRIEPVGEPEQESSSSAAPGSREPETGPEPLKPRRRRLFGLGSS